MPFPFEYFDNIKTVSEGSNIMFQGDFARVSTVKSTLWSLALGAICHEQLAVLVNQVY